MLLIHIQYKRKKMVACSHPIQDEKNGRLLTDTTSAEALCAAPGRDSSGARTVGGRKTCTEVSGGVVRGTLVRRNFQNGHEDCWSSSVI